MYENISLAQILVTLDDVSIQLKNTAGNDAFISQPDLDQLLLPSYASDIERAYLLGALFAIADITEPTAGGRISKNDIDRATQIIIEKVIPQKYVAALSLGLIRKNNGHPFRAAT